MAATAASLASEGTTTDKRLVNCAHIQLDGLTKYGAKAAREVTVKLCAELKMLHQLSLDVEGKTPQEAMLMEREVFEMIDRPEMAQDILVDLVMMKKVLFLFLLSLVWFVLISSVRVFLCLKAKSDQRLTGRSVTAPDNL